MSNNCVRTFCPAKAKHQIFFYLREKLVNLTACCECYSRLNKLCKSINEVVSCISDVAPNPTSDWDKDKRDPKDLKLPGWTNLMLCYLQDLLSQLDLSVSFPDSSHITYSLRVVGRNISFLDQTCQEDVCG